MSLEENKAIIRSGFEALNNHDLDLFVQFYAPDYVDRPNDLHGLADVKRFYGGVLKSFLGFHATVDDIIAEGDRVWVRCTITGTHAEEFRGISPTGKKIKIPTVLVFRMAKGKAVEKESETADMLDFYRQLGAVEPTRTGKKLFPQGVP